VSANRWADLRLAVRDNIGGRLELRLNDPVESDVGRSAAAALPAVPGRGLTTEGLQFQAALPWPATAPGPRPGAGEDRVAAATAPGLRAVAGEDREAAVAALAAWAVAGRAAPPLRLLPRLVRVDELPRPVAGEPPGVPFALDERRLAPVRLDLLGRHPHFLVLGDAGCGKTGLLRLLASGLAERHPPDQVQLVLVDYRRTLTEMAGGPHLAGYACNAGMAAYVVGWLGALLAERLPSATTTGGRLLARDGWSGPRYVLLVDDHDLTVTSTGSPLAPLVDLLGQGRDVGLHLILARPVGGTARSSFEPVFQRVRELGTPGLVLRGDPQEGPVLGGRRAGPPAARPRPPGPPRRTRHPRPGRLGTTLRPRREPGVRARRGAARPSRHGRCALAGSVTEAGSPVSATVLVTVVGPGGLTADLAVPAEVPVAELLVALRATLRDPAPAVPATLVPLGGEPLPPARSLAACGIGDGAVLALTAGEPDNRRPSRRIPATAGGRSGDQASSPLLAATACAWPADRVPRAAAPAWPDRLAAARPAPLPPSARLSLALRAVAGPGWRASLARGRQAWRDSSDERRLEAALAAAPAARCARVGVVGATPGAGATTVAVLLAAVLAAVRPGRTVAVDASPGRGSLTELLAPHHDLFADELLGLLEHPGLTRRELGAVLARRGDLAVLAARPGAGQPDGRGWTMVLRALARHATAVVVDCGPAASPGARAAVAVADQFVLVADARSPSPSAVAGRLARLGRPPVLLVDRSPGGLDAAEAVARVPGARAAVLLPDDPLAAAAVRVTAPSPGAPLDRGRPPECWRRQAHELALLLVAEWPFLGPEDADRPFPRGACASAPGDCKDRR
jgi:hypothetical protein